MKKFLFLVIVLFLFVSFIGCTEETKDNEIKDDETNKDNGNETVELIDCGADPACWEENLKNCIPAKFETGIGDQIRSLITIKGLEGNYCKIHYLATINPMPEVQDTYYECLVPKDKLTPENYQEWMQANLMTSCTGTFIDVSIDLYGSPDCMKTKIRIGTGFSNESTGGKPVKVIEVGDNQEIIVDVDGISDILQLLETKTINGVKIENLGIDGEMAEMEICSTEKKS